MWSFVVKIEQILILGYDICDFLELVSDLGVMLQMDYIFIVCKLSESLDLLLGDDLLFSENEGGDLEGKNKVVLQEHRLLNVFVDESIEATSNFFLILEGTQFIEGYFNSIENELNRERVNRVYFLQLLNYLVNRSKIRSNASELVSISIKNLLFKLTLHNVDVDFSNLQLALLKLDYHAVTVQQCRQTIFLRH